MTFSIQKFNSVFELYSSIMLLFLTCLFLFEEKFLNLSTFQNNLVTYVDFLFYAYILANNSQLVYVIAY
jgi:hypothetical protein